MESEKEPVKKVKKLTLTEKELAELITCEMKEFCSKLLASIEKAGNLVVTNPAELQEREKSRQFISKLIEYIGNCGKHSGKTGTIKYLLMSFIGVLDMAGEDQITFKGQHKAKKKTLVFLSEL